MLALFSINSILLSVTLKMGTSNSRPNICKVTPKEEQPFQKAASASMITAAQRFPHQQEILGYQKIGQLPPLKQHVPQIFSSAPGLQNVDATPIHSIIKSHPPQKAKAWQPTAHPTKPPAACNVSDEHVSMVHTCPRNVRGFLAAQTALIGQATKKRQSHRKHLREQRRIYTSSVGGDGNVERENKRLVSRPTQRDIFWDEMTGQNLDPRELLQSSPHLTDPDSGKKERKSEVLVGLGGNSGGFSMDLNESATKSPERKTQRRLPWLEDFRKHEQNHVNTWSVLEDGWGQYQWLDMPQERCEKTEREMGRKSTSQVNPVEQKLNSWG